MFSDISQTCDGVFVLIGKAGGGDTSLLNFCFCSPASDLKCNQMYMYTVNMEIFAWG